MPQPNVGTPDDLAIAGQSVTRGERRTIEIPLARIPATQLFMSLPVEVICGVRAGPRVWVSAAIHGDELNGIEIIRRVRRLLTPAKLAGTVLAVPIVNRFGFMNQSRYLPDRRDLNRSFPGSMKGSLAARLAAVFMAEVVAHCSHGIDFHTGSDHRSNLPQIRANMADPETRRAAQAFGAPVAIHAATRDGSLRDAAARHGKHVLLYEAGEQLRFDTTSIEAGVRGTLGVLATLGMLSTEDFPPPEPTSIVATKTQWVRARASGLFRLDVEAGGRVRKRQPLGAIADALGEMDVTVRAPSAGVVIGVAKNPMVHQGDALVHLATEFEAE